MQIKTKVLSIIFKDLYDLIFPLTLDFTFHKDYTKVNMMEVVCPGGEENVITDIVYHQIHVDYEKQNYFWLVLVLFIRFLQKIHLILLLVGIAHLP